MNIKRKINNKVKSLGFKIGCYSKKLDKVLNEENINSVLNNLDEEHIDLFIPFEDRIYVVEISTVDNEKDIEVYSAYDYFSKYGNLEDALENEDITNEQYEKIKNKLY